MTGNPIIDFKVPLNSASSSLDGAITNVAVALDVQTGDGGNFPATGDGDFWVCIDAEILLCTSRAGDTLTVVRGAQGTANVAHDDGAAVELRITQEAFEDIHANVVTGILQGWAEFGDHGVGVDIGTLPANSFVWRVDIWVLELFDAGNKLIDVGYAGVSTWLVNTFDVQAATTDHIDDGHADAGAGIGVVEATERDIEIMVNAAGCATGKVYVAAHYIVADAIP